MANKSQLEGNYDQRIGEYKTNKPISYNTLADLFSVFEYKVKIELSRIERKLGESIIFFKHETNP